MRQNGFIVQAIASKRDLLFIHNISAILNGKKLSEPVTPPEIIFNDLVLVQESHKRTLRKSRGPGADFYVPCFIGY